MIVAACAARGITGGLAAPYFQATRCRSRLPETIDATPWNAPAGRAMIVGSKPAAMIRDDRRDAVLREPFNREEPSEPGVTASVFLRL